MAQEQIKGDTGDLGSDGSLTTYTVPGSAIVTPYSVSVTFDGSGAAGNFLPCLTFKTITGAVIARCPAPGVAAGGTAEVSWFPHVGGSVSAADVTFVGARIENHAGQTITSGAGTDLVYDTVAFDTGGMANLGSNNRILTVQTAGLYLVICSTIWQYNNAGRRIGAVFQNGYYSNSDPAVASDSRMPVWAPVGGIGGGAPHSDNVTVGLLQASPGDFFSSGVLNASGSSIIVNGLSSGSNQDNYLSAILLGGN